ncbi:7234_t:CDS:2 [Paraglomus brasilianum]|uniref:7234_t:CDS:1 n=1 Tax=Paraglomus brasilianum TaxID=144538 RepID=A0A9N9C0D2_9GLOM|nr:7234_t:CDS:2 [Paraglomus brasilianum]
MRFKGSHAVIASIAVLGALIFFFPEPKAGSIPPQEKSRFTGYPAWHGTWQGIDPFILDASAGFSVLVGGIAGFLSIIWTNPSYPISVKCITSFYDGSHVTPTTLFNRVLAYYLLFTHFAGTAFLILDLGKLWLTFGVLHNAWEVALLLLLFMGGRVKSQWYFIILFVYIFIVVLLSVLLPWPFDAIFFKWQGLCSDFALPMVFTILYINTRKYLRNYGTDTIPLVLIEDVDEVEKHGLFPTTFEHPKQLIPLIFASVVHTGGNILATWFLQSLKAFLVFQFCYIISYPIYAYYIYLDTHYESASLIKRYYLPKRPLWKDVVIGIWSIVMSLSMIAIGVIICNNDVKDNINDM